MSAWQLTAAEWPYWFFFLPFYYSSTFGLAAFFQCVAVLELSELFGFLPVALLLLWLGWDELLPRFWERSGTQNHKQATAAAQKMRRRHWNWGKREVSVCLVRGCVIQTDPPSIRFILPGDHVLHPFLLPSLSFL